MAEKKYLGKLKELRAVEERGGNPTEVLLGEDCPEHIKKSVIRFYANLKNGIAVMLEEERIIESTTVKDMLLVIDKIIEKTGG